MSDILLSTTFTLIFKDFVSSTVPGSDAGSTAPKALTVGTSSGLLTLGNALQSNIFVYGLTYSIRWLQPFVDISPVIGVGISKNLLTAATPPSIAGGDIWNSTNDQQQDGMLHFDSHRDFPANSETWFGGHKIKILKQETVYVKLWVDNPATLASFDKTVRFHITLFYSLDSGLRQR